MSDVEMREKAMVILDGADLTTVRVIDADEAMRLAEIGQDDPAALTRADLDALALWAAKGGLARV